MPEIIERLRSVEHADVAQKYVMLEAAAEIERLLSALKNIERESYEPEITRLVREALETGAEA